MKIEKEFKKETIQYYTTEDKYILNKIYLDENKTIKKSKTINVNDVRYNGKYYGNVKDILLYLVCNKDYKIIEK